MREGSKPKRKRESRMRCQVCGGPLKVDDDYAKTPNIMVRKRRCLCCQIRYESIEVVKIRQSDKIEQKLFD